MIDDWKPGADSNRLKSGCLSINNQQSPINNSSGVYFKPGARKAHGNAGTTTTSGVPEPRRVGLSQTGTPLVVVVPKALLEQPSSSRLAEQTPGRRNIVQRAKRTAGM
jgi:hypothetical protein